MDYFLILRLSLFGLLIAFCSIYFLPVKFEPFCWVICYFISALIVTSRIHKRQFITGVLIGWIDTFWMILVLLFNYKTFVRLHPDVSIMLAHLDKGVNPFYFILIFKGAIGLFSGLIPGTFAIIINKVRSIFV